MPAPVNPALARVLDGVAGLRPVSSTSAFALWRLADFPARVRVVEASGKIVPLRSGAVGVAGAAAPAAGGTLELAEPSGGWNATLNGHPLTAVASPAGGWAQAFRLPPGGGKLSIGHDDTGHDVALLLELLVFAAVAVLALPGISSAAAAPVAEVAGAAGDSGEAAGTVAGGASGPAGTARPAGPAGPGRRGHGGGRSRSRDKGRADRAGRPGKAARRPAADREGPHRTRRSIPSDPALQEAASLGTGGPGGAAVPGSAAVPEPGTGGRVPAARGSADRGSADRGSADLGSAGWDSAGWGGPPGRVRARRVGPLAGR